MHAFWRHRERARAELRFPKIQAAVGPVEIFMLANDLKDLRGVPRRIALEIFENLRIGRLSEHSNR
jgi:hypothetical protein